MTPLHGAAQGGHKDVVEMLLLKGAYPNLGDKRDGITPLHYASTKGFKEVVGVLLDAGATPNVTTTNFTHETPLHTPGFKAWPRRRGPNAPVS